MKNVFVLSKKNIALLGMGTVGKAVYEEIKGNVSKIPLPIKEVMPLKIIAILIELNII